MADKIKGALFSMLASLGVESERVLDLCTGTADLALAAVDARPGAARVVGVDFAGAMLRVAELHGAGEVLDRLARAIPTADSALRRRRLAALGTAMFALLAERERSANSIGGVDEITSMLAAMLTAPMREPAAAAVE